MQTNAHQLRGPLSDWWHLISCRSWTCWEQRRHTFSVCQRVHSLPFRMSLSTLQLWRESNGLLPSLLVSSFINQPLLKVSKPPDPSTNLVHSLLGFIFPLIIKIPLLFCTVTPAVRDILSLSLYLPLFLCSFFNAPPQPPSSLFSVTDHHSSNPLRVLPRRVTAVIRAGRLLDAHYRHPDG